MAKKSAVETKKERRKKTTLRLIEREHAGKVVEPYQILEDLIAKHHTALSKAKIAMLWKTGWKTDKDGLLTRASIRKATEADRERHGDCDYMIFLHRELWQCKGFSTECRRHDVDHELCHAAPEIDDASGNQRVDERDRLCWRLVKHRIQSFPALVERYGLETATGIDGAALLKAEGEAAKQAAAAEENDATRTLLAAAERTEAPAGAEKVLVDGWRKTTIESISFRGNDARHLIEADITTAGELQDRMTRHGLHWHRDVPGIGEAGRDRIDAVFNCFIAAMTRKAETAAEEKTHED